MDLCVNLAPCLGLNNQVLNFISFLNSRVLLSFKTHLYNKSVCLCLSYTKFGTLPHKIKYNWSFCIPGKRLV